MLHKRSAALILAVSLPALAGCVQATRHSNTLMFGTNTTVGVKAGQNASQVPEVTIGFDRQEAVIMPLLANVDEYGGLWESLSPCDPVAKKTSSFETKSSIRDLKRKGDATYTQDTTAETVAMHPCKFVGIRKGENNFLIQDSYSVLASFGARMEGNGKDSTATVGLAQYFATGAAAQTLAITGGAAIVSVGAATGKAVDNKDNAANAAAALTGNTPVTNITPACATINPDTAVLNLRFRELMGTADGDNPEIRKTAADGLGMKVPDGSVPTWPDLAENFDQKLCDDAKKKNFLDALET